MCVRCVLLQVFEKYDVNDDGQLNFVEYMNAVAAHPTLESFVTRGATAKGEGEGEGEAGEEKK